jgi:small subunit ribosomal protein S5e
LGNTGAAQAGEETAWTFGLQQHELNSLSCFHPCSFDDVEVNDISLEDYIAVKPKFAVFVPHTAGRYQKKRFRKAQCPIVERWDSCSRMHRRSRK